jgi:transcription-repair coupling factor (superfamily II helicase)
MNSLFAALSSNTGVKKLQACLQAAPQETLVYGLSNSQKHAIMAAAWQQAPQPMVILVHSSEAVSDWRENLLSLLPGQKCSNFPKWT